MHGNVWEWCADDGDGRETRIVRGGSWDFEPARARSAARLSNPQDNTPDNTGFRVVMQIEP
jgi:formylglycine-generating enzyme required for sulfatase activity